MAVPTLITFQNNIASNLTADELNTLVRGGVTFAQLRNFPAVPNVFIFALGATVLNDGGQGMFTYVNGSAVDDNQNTLVVNKTLTSPPAYWQRVTLLGNSYISFEFLGGQPAIASEVVGLIVFEQPAGFLGNFAGARGRILTNPTSSFVCNITQNGTSVGSMTISTSGVFTFTSSLGLPVNCVAGDYLSFVAPVTPDATAANFSWTLVGSGA